MRGGWRHAGRIGAIAIAVLTVACGGGDDAADAGVSDGAMGLADGAVADAPGLAADGAAGDAGGGGPDGAASLDAGPVDAGPVDAAAVDAQWPDATPPDAGHTTEHVHIYIDNQCRVSTDPEEIVVPPGGSVNIQWHNHSEHYEADVWMSYGGGYLELARGGTWNEIFEWCAGVAVYTGTADIGPAGVSNSVCPHVYFPIRCL